MKVFLLTLVFSWALNFNAEASTIKLFPEDQAGLEEASNSVCMEDYRTLRNRYAVISGLEPFVGIAGIVGSGFLALGWEYGGWYAFKASLGSLLPAAQIVVSHVIPMVVITGTITYEIVAITRFKRASRGYRLLK